MIAALILIIFVAELTVMLALGRFREAIPWWMLTLIDTAMLTALVSLFMWPGLIAPLRGALELERTRARVVLDNAAEGIVTIDPNGAIRAFNHAAERMFGHAAGAAIGQNIRLIVPEPHKSRHDGYLKRYRETGRSEVFGTRRQVLAERSDGSMFPCELSLSESRVGDERLITAILLDVTQREHLEDEIRRLAHYDALTGLPNRALYLDRLDHALALAQRQRLQVGLLFLDLDDFKPINDTLGHDQGDEVLRQVAARLGQAVRASDTVARLGGDEFTIILTTIQGRAEAEETASRIVAACEAPLVLGATTLSPKMSVGIAVYPVDGLTARDLTHVADMQMYSAKRLRRASADRAAP